MALTTEERAQLEAIAGSPRKKTLEGIFATDPTSRADIQAETERQQGVGGIMGVNVGAAKGVASTLTGASSLGERMIKGLGRLVTPKKFEEKLGFAKEETTSAERLVPEKFRKAEGTAEKIGFGIEQFAEFLIPGTASLKAGKIASTAAKAKGLGKVGQGLAKFGGIGGTEAVLGTGQAGLQSGEIGKEEAVIGGVSLVTPAILSGLGKGIKAVTPQPVKNLVRETIEKAVRPSAKSVNTPGYFDKGENAFRVMNKYKTLSGDVAGEVRNPETVAETLTALKGAKAAIYKIYDAISRKATNRGAQFSASPIIADTLNLTKSKGWSAKIKEYANKQAKSLADLEGASPSKVQDRVEELTSSYNPMLTGEQRLQQEIDLSIASRLRTNLDELIEGTTGKEYQYFKNEYSDLKTIERDLARAAGAQLRKGKAGLMDMTDIFTGGEISAGLVTGNPALFVKGMAGKGVKEWLKYLNDPNRLIKRTFEVLGKEPVSNAQAREVTERLLTEGVTETPTVTAPINLGARAQSTVDTQELKRLIEQTDKRKLLEGLENLDEDKLKKLLTEGSDSFNSPAVGKTVDLATEAKKYKTAEEFIEGYSDRINVGMAHRPSYEGMPPVHNLLEGETLPRDVYTKPDFSIASGRIRGGDKSANESWKAIQDIKGKPDAEITVYRASPKNELRNGDWISLSKEYAKEESLSEGVKVHSFKVPARDVIFAGDDINEFGYWEKTKLTDIFNKANK